MFIMRILNKMDYNKLEKIISAFVKTRLGENITGGDNFYGVAVDIYNTNYGKQCHVTVLMKNPFSGQESNIIHEELRETKSAINSFFPHLKGGVHYSTSTINSYNNGKWWYEKNKESINESENKVLKLIKSKGLFYFLNNSGINPYELAKKVDLDSLSKEIKYQFLDDTSEQLLSQWISDYVSNDKLASLMYTTKTLSGTRIYEIQYFGGGGVTGERFDNNGKYLGLVNLEYSELPERIFNNLYEIVLYDVYYNAIYKEN